MEHEKQLLLTEILHDSSKQSEDRLLSAMLGIVERRKTIKRAAHIASLATVLAVAIVFWQFFIVGKSKEVYRVQTEPGLAAIIETSTNVDIIFTSSNYISYVNDQSTIVNRIDDGELEKIFSNKAYAIVDNNGKGKEFFTLAALEEELSF